MEAGALAGALQAPELRRFADLTVEVGKPVEVGAVGHGTRRVIPILGGTCTARDWSAPGPGSRPPPALLYFTPRSDPPQRRRGTAGLIRLNAVW